MKAQTGHTHDSNAHTKNEGGLGGLWFVFCLGV